MNTKLRVSGLVSIFMVMNMRRFVYDEQAQQTPGRWARVRSRWRWGRQLSSIDCFEQLRGGKAYAAFLRQLQPAQWFEQDPDEARAETAGHALGVFRQYLIEHYFFPTYRLTNAASALNNDALYTDSMLAERLDGWTFKVRLTRHGLVAVKLERQLQDTPLTDVSRMILEIQQTPISQAAGLPTQWQLAMDIVARFVEACGCQFVVPSGGDDRTPKTVSKRTVVVLEPRYPTKRLPLHDRHINYTFSQVTCEGEAVSAEALVQQHAGEIVGLLENAMVLKDGEFYYPIYKPAQLARLADLDIASWNDELCLITSEATLIFCPFAVDKTVVISGSTRADGTTFYGDYWRSITRGIEHIVVLKNEVQLLERETTKLLETIPEITRKAADGHLSRSDRREILNLASGVSRLFQTLPQQRDALVPSSVFRASYATSKFQRLMQLLGINEIEQHIEVNVQELNAFLAHFNSIQLQQDDRYTNLLFSILTISFTLLAVPSFLADLMQIRQDILIEPKSFSNALALPFQLLGSLFTGSHVRVLFAIVALGLAWFVWLMRQRR